MCRIMSDSCCIDVYYIDKCNFNGIKPYEWILVVSSVTISRFIIQMYLRSAKGWAPGHSGRSHPGDVSGREVEHQPTHGDVSDRCVRNNRIPGRAASNKGTGKELNSVILKCRDLKLFLF